MRGTKLEKREMLVPPYPLERMRATKSSASAARGVDNRHADQTHSSRTFREARPRWSDRHRSEAKHAAGSTAPSPPRPQGCRIIELVRSKEVAESKSRHGLSSRCGRYTEHWPVTVISDAPLTDPASYVARWDGIKAVVTDPRMLAAMWDAPDEQAKRQEIRDELSRRDSD